MPTLTVDPTLTMAYTVDDFTDPWVEAETVLMIHGNAERGAAWFGWVPTLARHVRVVRPDTRGYGDSTPMPRDYPWTLDRLIDDYCTLMDALDCPRFHLVGAKIGGTIARAFAARRPDRVLTLTVAGTPPPLWEGRAERVPAQVAMLDALGVGHWARESMGARLGARFPAAGSAWWTAMMARTSVDTLVGFTRHIVCADIRADLPRIACPTLVLTTEGSALGSTDRTRAWAAMIPRARVVALPGDSYHVAVSDPERCAEETLAFIRAARAR